MSIKFEPPSELLAAADEVSPYSPDDYAETPYPRATAVKAQDSGVRAGAWADWSCHEIVTDEYHHTIVADVTWNNRRITLDWSIQSTTASGDVWIGIGTMKDRTTERWYLAEEASPGTHRWEIGGEDLHFDPGIEPWWFEIIAATK